MSELLSVEKTLIAFKGDAHLKEDLLSKLQVLDETLATKKMDHLLKEILDIPEGYWELAREYGIPPSFATTIDDVAGYLPDEDRRACPHQMFAAIKIGQNNLWAVAPRLLHWALFDNDTGLIRSMTVENEQHALKTGQELLERRLNGDEASSSVWKKWSFVDIDPGTQNEDNDDYACYDISSSDSEHEKALQVSSVFARQSAKQAFKKIEQNPYGLRSCSVFTGHHIVEAHAKFKAMSVWRERSSGWPHIVMVEETEIKSALQESRKAYQAEKRRYALALRDKLLELIREGQEQA